MAAATAASGPGIETADLECPICLTVFERPVQLTCGHTICATCSQRMVEAERDNNPFLELPHFLVWNDQRRVPPPPPLPRPRLQGFADGNARRVIAIEAIFDMDQEREQHGFWIPRLRDPAPRAAAAGVGGAGGPEEVLRDHNYQAAIDGAEAPGQEFARAEAQLVGFGGGWLGPALRREREREHRDDFFARRDEHRDDIGVAGFAPPGLRPPRVRRNGNGGGSIRCPECRKVTVVPAEGLPTNYTVLHMVQRMKQVREAAQQQQQPAGVGAGPVQPETADRLPCEECRELLRPDIHFICQDCNPQKSLCAHCAIISHKGHNIIEQSAIAQEEINQLQTSFNTTRTLMAETHTVTFRALTQLEATSRDLNQAIARYMEDVGCLETALQYAGRTGNRQLFEAARNGIVVVQQIFASVGDATKAFVDTAAMQYADQQQRTLETLHEVFNQFREFTNNKREQDSPILRKVKEDMEQRRKQNELKYRGAYRANLFTRDRAADRRRERHSVRFRLDRQKPPKKHREACKRNRIAGSLCNCNDSDEEETVARIVRSRNIGRRAVKLEPEDEVAPDLPGPSGLNNTQHDTMDVMEANLSDEDDLNRPGPSTGRAGRRHLFDDDDSSQEPHIIASPEFLAETVEEPTPTMNDN